MSSHYKEFSVSASRNFYYRFICEHCGKTTDWKSEMVTRSACLRKSTSTISLTPEETTALQDEANKKLQIGYEKIKSYAEVKNYISMMKEAAGVYEEGAGGKIWNNLLGICPFCNKKQSWDSRSTQTLINWSAGGLVFGFLLMLVISYFTNDIEYLKYLPVSILVSFSLLGLIIGITQYKKGTDKIPKGLKKNDPEFRWE
ncbi:MAG: hypothetical protein FWG72_02510 [Oscillospiraceae bacterium]|nr:hypothetical protein [Oscillospiraceae bacterium]